VALGQHFPELVEQSAQGIGLHDAKLHQLRAQPVQGKNRLLLLAFDGDQSRFRLLDRRPDRPRIDCIGLVGAHEWAHRLGCQQFDLVAQAAQLSRPPVGTAARFDRHQRGTALGKERQHFIATQLNALDLAGRRIDAVQLKDTLGDIHANYAMLHFISDPPAQVVTYPSPLWHIDAVAARIHLRLSARAVPRPAAGGRRPYHLIKSLGNRQRADSF
jgi:hypothetical protein